MSELGFVTQKDSQFVAKINTKDLGKQYRFTGPPRGEDEQQAYQDFQNKLCNLVCAPICIQARTLAPHVPLIRKSLISVPYRHQANGGGHPVWLEQESI